MLDADLASFYEVETRLLNQNVKNNQKRFPPDFMFKLNEEEFENLTSQNMTSKGRGGSRKLPNVFNLKGIASLSAVVNTDKAIEIHNNIIREFVGMKTAFQASTGSNDAEINAIKMTLASHDKSFTALFMLFEQFKEEQQKGERIVVKGFEITGE